MCVFVCVCVCVWSLFCYAVLSVLSSFAIHPAKEETAGVLCLFPTAVWVGLYIVCSCGIS